MRILLSILFLLGANVSLHATLFFWNSADSNVYYLHFDGYDICIEGGGASGMNSIDIVRAKKYIQDVLMPNQDVMMRQKLQQLLHLLNLNTVSISYARNVVHNPNRILPVDTTQKAVEVPKKPVLTSDQKRDLLLAFLAKQGLAKTINH